LHTASISSDRQHLASVRSLVERLAEHLHRPDPNLEITQVLADVALSGLRKLECASRLEQLLEDERGPEERTTPPGTLREPTATEVQRLAVSGGWPSKEPVVPA
jgi:hypothetical protein